jgi:serine/threonine protein kinase
MGNSNLRSTIAETPNFQADLPKFIIQSKIGNGKLMKTYLMRCDGNLVVVKVYISQPDEDLRALASKLTQLWYTLSPSRHPYFLPTQLWMKSSSRPQKATSFPIYLIRQHIYSNLYDRLSTRPFLSEIEKMWILYQIFRAIETSHSLRVIHGDIKPENILCTTWNWVTLTDFASFKPVTIPDDDPSDFQYYFDTMGRARCSIAPERFLSKNSPSSKKQNIGGPTSTATQEGKQSYDSVFGDLSSLTSDYAVVVGPNGKNPKEKQLATVSAAASHPTDLQPSMDVFSLGCIVAEVLLDGEPLLDLSGMMRYLYPATAASSSTSQRTSSSSSSSSAFNSLDQAGSPAKSLMDRLSARWPRVQQVVTHMTQRDPLARLSVAEYRLLLERRSITVSAKQPNEIEVESGKEDKSRTKIRSPFPQYFGANLYPLFLRMHWEGVDPDARLAILCKVSIYSSFLLRRYQNHTCFFLICYETEFRVIRN